MLGRGLDSEGLVGKIKFKVYFMVRIGDVLQSPVSIKTSLRLREWSRDVETDYINGMNL